MVTGTETAHDEPILQSAGWSRPVGQSARSQVGRKVLWPGLARSGGRTSSVPKQVRALSGYFAVGKAPAIRTVLLMRMGLPADRDAWWERSKPILPMVRRAQSGPACVTPEPRSTSNSAMDPDVITWPRATTLPSAKATRRLRPNPTRGTVEVGCAFPLKTLPGGPPLSVAVRPQQAPAEMVPDCWGDSGRRGQGHARRRAGRGLGRRPAQKAGAGRST